MNVLGEDLNKEIYKLAINKNDTFSLSRTSYSKYYPQWRKSKVIYDNQFTYFKQLLEQKLRDKLDEIHCLLEIKTFPIETFEMQLTSHNNGEYFKHHKDNGTPETASRQITFVYYFHAIPKQFSGGQLIIYDKESCYEIEPENDSMVLFYSGRKHEVTPVICPSNSFEDGRFTLNGWIRSRRLLQNNNAAVFGYNIFSPNTHLNSRKITAVNK
jgi:SM-20-related protein